MGQAKRRGTREERVELARAWEDAYREKWTRERPARSPERRQRPPLALIAALSSILTR